MHVRKCTADTIRIPFHVGDDASRTWVVTRTTTGYRLKHDHRHRDGSEDKLTQYGGNSTTSVTPRASSSPPTPSPRRCWCARITPPAPPTCGRSRSTGACSPTNFAARRASSGSSSTSPARSPRRQRHGGRAKVFVRRPAPVRPDRLMTTALATQGVRAYIALTLLDIVKTLGPGRGRSGSARTCMTEPV